MYAIGGFSGKCFLNTIEYLDENTNEWTTFVQQNVALISQAKHSDGIQQIEKQFSKLLSKSESCNSASETIDTNNLVHTENESQSTSFPIDEHNLKLNGMKNGENHLDHPNEFSRAAES